MTTATGKPEDVFHRVAREEGFWGRYNLSDAEDGLRELLTDIRTEMNKAFASRAREHAARYLNAPVDHPGLDQALLEVFLTAGVSFFHRLHEPFHAALVDERSHPAELSRIKTVYHRHAGLV